MTQRRPRMLDPGFLAFLRKKPCCVCNRAAPSEAAHIRMTSLANDKPITGMGTKSDDAKATPLCAWHHRESPQAQHNMGEAEFWKRHGIDPFTIAAKLYAEYGGTGGKPKPRTIIKPRLPKEQRTKIPRHVGPWPKRKFGK